MSIELVITYTGKGYSPKAKWQRLNEEVYNFENVAEAMRWLGIKYGSCKRSKMYIDPDAKHVGYIYGYHNSDWSHLPLTKWISQDWVEFREVNHASL